MEGVDNVVSSIVESVVAGLAKESYMKDGDYIGDDEMLCCGKCHTRKEREIDFLGMGDRKSVV